MKPMSRFLRLIAILLLPASALAQNAATPSGTPGITLSVTTRLVYVDVIVRDSSGHVVHGLTQQDFQVLEDGKPQRIDFFNAHSYSSAAAALASPKAASKLEFSNIAPEGASGAINILLFDLVNTPATDQLYARGQMLKFLEALPFGQRVALFVLSDRLRMIQGFTGSSDLLVSAAKMLDPKDFHLLRSQTEQLQDADEFVRLAAALGRDPGNVVEHWIKGHGRDDAINTDWRARFTLAALAELARATSGYPGRKNLLWLADSFPLSVGAQMEYHPDAAGPGDTGRDLGHTSADLQSLRRRPT
jgi:VWFA-related protein